MKTLALIALLFLSASCLGENPLTLKGMKIKQISPMDNTVRVKRSASSVPQRDCSTMDFDPLDSSTYPNDVDIDEYRHCF